MVLFSFNFKTDNIIEFYINNELITSATFNISNNIFNKFHIDSSFTGFIDVLDFIKVY